MPPRPLQGAGWGLSYASKIYCFVLRCLSSLAPRPQMTRCAAPVKLDDVAIAACTRAINSGAERPSVNYHNRGALYRVKDDTDRDIADFTEAIRLDPKYATAHVNRGITYGMKGDMDRAIADFTEAIRLDPELADAYVSRGLAYEKLADFGRAGPTSTLRLDCHKRAQHGRMTRRESGLPPYLRRHQQRRRPRNPTWGLAIVTSTAPVLNRRSRLANHPSLYKPSPSSVTPARYKRRSNKSTVNKCLVRNNKSRTEGKCYAARRTPA